MASNDVEKLLSELKPLARRVGRQKIKGRNFYKLGVASSFAKCFDYVEFAHSEMQEASAFHCVGGLRSICEDLIILKFLQSLGAVDRDIAFECMMHLEISDKIKTQEAFFARFRGGQRVLTGSLKEAARDKIERDLIELWKRHGWNKKKPDRPNTRELAGKLGSRTLEVLYEYMFRLTSNAVHFSPGFLLRMGWGKSLAEFEFSPRHIGVYYLEFCRIYGALLLTCYFELFPREIPLSVEEKILVEELRQQIAAAPRWPELVTFEEMNIEYPGHHVLGVAHIVMMGEHFKKGFIRQIDKGLAQPLKHAHSSALRALDRAATELAGKK